MCGSISHRADNGDSVVREGGALSSTALTLKRASDKSQQYNINFILKNKTQSPDLSPKGPNRDLRKG